MFRLAQKLDISYLTQRVEQEGGDLSLLGSLSDLQRHDPDVP